MWVPTWLPSAMRIGGGAIAPGPHIAMLLDQAEQERRVRGVVRHAHEIGLRQVVDRGAGNGIP